MASLSRSLFGHLIPAYGVLEHGSHCTPLERGDLDISYSIDIGDLYRVPYPVT